MGTHKELDSLKLQLVKDFLLNKNKLSSYVIQGFPTRKRTLFGKYFYNICFCFSLDPNNNIYFQYLHTYYYF